MPSIEQLQYLLKLADHGNFGQAAEAAFITQPALTKSIRQLEAWYGVPLFDRRKDGVVPTPYGEVVIDRVRALLGAFDASKRDIQLLAGLRTGELRIGTAPYSASYLLPTALSKLIEQSPGVRFRIEVKDPRTLIDMVVRSEIDLYLGGIHNVRIPKDATVISLPSEDYVACCRRKHPALRKKVLKLVDILQYPFIGPSFHVKFDRFLRNVLETQRASTERVPPLVLECDDTMVVLSILEQTNCISALPRSVLRRYIQRGTLKELRIETGIRTETGVVYLRDRTLPPIAQTLIGVLKNILESEADLNTRGHGGY
ncbi:MAG: LysR family transcriptional regulator [Candidatus Lindowbacteria bacterium]|nr:LysR family transcriptional regulator [Candidatus Lindowbacteria bacterium]